MASDNRKSLTVSAVLNLLSAVTVLVCLVFVVCGIGEDTALAAINLNAFKYYTVDSNVLQMLAAVIFLIYETRVLKGKAESVPKAVYVLKLASTGSVTLTMLVTVFFLSYTIPGGFRAMFAGANLYFHLLVPLVSITGFVFFERTGAISRKDLLYCEIPTVLYAVIYAVNVFAHAENGQVSMKYDWYGFVRGGLDKAWIPVIALVGGMYVITLVFRKLNRIKNNETSEEVNNGKS